MRGTGSTRYSIIAYGSSNDGEDFVLTNNEGDNPDLFGGVSGQQAVIRFDDLSRPSLSNL